MDIKFRYLFLLNGYYKMATKVGVEHYDRYLHWKQKSAILKDWSDKSEKTSFSTQLRGLHAF